ncbi:MAG: hypothetical protein CSA62_10905 [Planctomycetota bacterium]|nr:MAG: hypothetical protein CSA62_10905 [Planctomycetota bacterium]
MPETAGNPALQYPAMHSHNKATLLRQNRSLSKGKGRKDQELHVAIAAQEALRRLEFARYMATTMRGSRRSGGREDTRSALAFVTRTGR